MSGDLVALSREFDERKNLQRSLEQALKDKDTLIKNLTDERKLLEELQTVNAMTVRKLENPDRQRSNKAQLSQESLDRIVQLENHLKHRIKEREKLEKQRDVLNNQIRTKDDALSETRRKTDDLKTMVSWDSRTIKSKDDYVDMENKTLELKKRITALQEEQQAVRQVTLTKTSLIEDLARSLEQYRNVDDELFNAQTSLKVKERELEDLREDMRTLDRIAHKKNRMLENLRQEDEQKKFKSFETQKRVMHHEIQKAMEIRRQNDRSILAQQSRIDALEDKLRIIANVVRTKKEGATLTPEEQEAYRPGLEFGQETVGVDDFEQAQKELMEMRATLDEREEQLTELDGEIESVENKVSVLARAKECAAKKHVLERRDQMMEAAQLEAFIQVRNDAYQQQLEHLTEENAKLEGCLQRVAK